MRLPHVTITDGGEFADFYGAQYARVRRALSLSLGDADLADEATAEAFARALARWPEVRRAGSPSAWVYTVGLNLVRSTLRRRRLERRYLLTQRPVDSPAPAEPDPALWQAVASLPQRTRTAVALRYVADLPEAQIAEVMGVTRGTVASTLHDARARLATLLADRAPTPAAAAPAGRPDALPPRSPR